MRTDKATLKHYRKFRSIGERPEQAIRSARTLKVFEELELKGKVRILADQEEENYFDVYGEPDTEKERESIIEAIGQHGLNYVYSEYFDRGEWHNADGIGMCIYSNPCDPFENSYVTDLMQSAVDQYNEAKRLNAARKRIKNAKRELKRAKRELKNLNR